MKSPEQCTRELVGSGHYGRAIEEQTRSELVEARARIAALEFEVATLREFLSAWGSAS